MRSPSARPAAAGNTHHHHLDPDPRPALRPVQHVARQSRGAGRHPLCRLGRRHSALPHGRRFQRLGRHRLHLARGRRRHGWHREHHLFPRAAEPRPVVRRGDLQRRRAAHAPDADDRFVGRRRPVPRRHIPGHRQPGAAPAGHGRGRRHAAGADHAADRRPCPAQDLPQNLYTQPREGAAGGGGRRMTIPSRSLRVSLVALLATGVVGCTVGPDFKLPDPPKDKTYLTGTSPEETVAVPDVLGGEAQRFVTDLDIPAQWWQVYRSRPLNDLIERSLRANPDIQTPIQSQIAVTQRTIDIQRQTLDLLQRRFAIGQSSRADVATQEAALAQSEATLPPLTNQLNQQRHRLAQLTGQTTAHVPAETFELGDLSLPQTLPVSLPSRMVEQRPDVRSAESSVHAAAASVGVATAALLPHITRGATYGSTATSSDLLFSALLGPTVVAGGSVAQTLLAGGALLAERRAALAASAKAMATDQSTGPD